MTNRITDSHDLAAERNTAPVPTTGNAKSGAPTPLYGVASGPPGCGSVFFSFQQLIRREVVIVADTGCWECQGRRLNKGHVQTYIKDYTLPKNKRYQLAHRIAYEMFVGPIPEGLQVLHRCDNPPCVNPAHLYVGTHADNMRDMAERGGTRKSNRKQPLKLTKDDVRELRRLRAAGVRGVVLARRFDINEDYALAVARGRHWRCVE